MNFEDEYSEPTLEDLEEIDEVFEVEPDLDAPVNELSPQSRKELSLKMLRHVYENLGHAIELLESGNDAGAATRLADLLAGKSQMVREKEELMGRKVVEGIFDALSISGLACMHETISKDQAQLLKQLQRRIIVVPDQDRAGLSIIDAAVEHKFEVSIPEWPEDVKDVNDAILKYGRMFTLHTIVSYAEESELKIKLRSKKWFV